MTHLSHPLGQCAPASVTKAHPRGSLSSRSISSHPGGCKSKVLAGVVSPRLLCLACGWLLSRHVLIGRTSHRVSSLGLLCACVPGVSLGPNLFLYWIPTHPKDFILAYHLFKGSLSKYRHILRDYRLGLQHRNLGETKTFSS